MGTVLAFDFGEKRTASPPVKPRLAPPIPPTVIHAESNAQRLAEIGKLVAEWQPQQLVVGLPTHADGTPYAMTQLARKFAERLHKHFALPVALADERLTSRDAESRLRETGRNAKAAKPLLDAVAAQLILQTWLDSTPHVAS